MPGVAILDDYAGVALELADWSPVRDRSELTVFGHHLSEAQAVEALRPFDVVCTMRERMSFPRTLIERLPNLKLITIVGKRLPNLDTARGHRALRPGRALRLRPSAVSRRPRRHPGVRLGFDDRDRAESGRRASAHACRRMAGDHRYDVVGQDAWAARAGQGR